MFKPKWKLACTQCLNKKESWIKDAKYTMAQWLNVFSMYGFSGVEERLNNSVE